MAIIGKFRKLFEATEDEMLDPTFGDEGETEMDDTDLGDEVDPEEEGPDLFDQMASFITTMDPETLDDDQKAAFDEIVAALAAQEDEEGEEEDEMVDSDDAGDEEATMDDEDGQITEAVKEMVKKKFPKINTILSAAELKAIEKGAKTDKQYYNDIAKAFKAKAAAAK